MPDTEQRGPAEILFEPTRAPVEISDALSLEEERRAVLVKNMYRLRALRLHRGQPQHADPSHNGGDR
jgi:hypothetical protein